MDTRVVMYGDTVVVDGFRGEEHVQLEGTIVGISEYCYTIRDKDEKDWDVEPSLVKLA